MKRFRLSVQFSALTILILISSIQSCQPIEKGPPPASDPYGHIKDNEARALLQKGIERAGGLEAWNNLQTLHFEKYFALYDSTGAVETEARQVHDYRFLPNQQINISWNAGGALHKMVYENGQAGKTIDGQIDASANAPSLLNNVLSATFVISIPFKLLDEGTELRYLGVDTLEDNQVVEVLQANYHPDEHDNLTTPDTWHHYFDRDDFTLVAYKVRHADHYSYVKNLGYTTAGGFLFPTERVSYRVDEDRNILYLRAAYEYSDYEVASVNN